MNSHIEITIFKNEIASLKPLVKEVKVSMVFSAIDKGEIEAITLYQMMDADLLLIDDKKAREVAESLDISCIGTLAILIKAKRDNLITSLREVFLALLANKRYYKIEVLNKILSIEKEQNI